jgi:hypothetical protein
MSKHASRPTHPASHTPQATIARGSRLVRAARALKLAGVMLNFSSQFAPLGDNGELLADLAVRARAARDFGA